MARLIRILKAVAQAAGRRSSSLRQISGNNMFYAGVALTFMLDPFAMALFLVLIGLVVFLPSSADPLTTLPRERLELWPLTRRERFALRLASPLLNPVAWLILAGLAYRRLTWGLWALVAGFFLGGFLGSALPSPNVRVPWLPAGRLTQLIRKDLRQFAMALDLYCALLLSIPALVLRWRGQLPTESHIPLTGLELVILSTMALTLFGLDGAGGRTRYALLSLPAWQVLLAKGIAYLLLVAAATLPLAPVGGLAGGLVALGVGQWHAVQRPLPQARWRFRASAPFAVSMAQMVLSILAFGLVTQLGPGWIVAPLGFYVASLVCSARRLEARGFD